MKQEKSNRENNEIFDIDGQIEEISQDPSKSQPSKQEEKKEMKNTEVESLKNQLEKKEKEYQKIYSQYLRALADYDNLQKRTSKEKANFFKNANEALIKKLLDLADTFDRTAEEIDNRDKLDVDVLIDSFNAAYKQFNTILKNEGVEKIEAIGKIFDPNYHEVVLVQVDDTKEENTIINEVQKGYMLNSRVIRPSKVVIAKKSKNGDEKNA
ncbi:MAG: nucleotide exchange factor GrpE [Candidatus Hodarchaeales archaeon]